MTRSSSSTSWRAPASRNRKRRTCWPSCARSNTRSNSKEVAGCPHRAPRRILSLTFTNQSTILRGMGRVSDARERLLEATLELTWRESYGAVTVDAICERAGVKKGSFYYFFDSKSRLTAEALKHHWESLQPAYDQIFSPSVPPLERFRRYFDFLYQRH